MTQLRTSLIAPVLCVVLACSSSGSGGTGDPDGGGGQTNSASGSSNSGDGDGDGDTNAAGSSGNGSGDGDIDAGDMSGDGDMTDGDGGMDDSDSGADAGGMSAMSADELVLQAINGDPDPFTAAVRDEITENIPEWELDYLMQIDWTAGDPLLDDPSFFSLLQALNNVAQTTADPFTQALLLCDDEPSVRRRERVYMSCTGWPNIKLMVADGVSNALALAAGITYVGRNVAKEEGSTVQQTMSEFMSCNQSGRPLNDILRRSLDPCLRDSDCVQITETVEGTHCNSATSYDIHYENTCNYAIAVHFCFPTPSGEWDCGVESNLAGGAQGFGGAWTCNWSGADILLEAMSQTQYLGECSFYNPPPL